MPSGSSTTRPPLRWQPKMCFADCARSYATRRKNRSPSRLCWTGKTHGSTTTREANSFSHSSTRPAQPARSIAMPFAPPPPRSPKRSKPRPPHIGSATCIQVPGSIRTIKSGSATRKTIEGGTWWAKLDPAWPRFLPSLPSDRAQAAWDELYAAEGSDWFWWYGDDFDTDYKAEFDRLFRTHLRNVWTIAGLTPPEQLNQPICHLRAVPDADLVTMPLALLTPSIDGQVTDFFEWRGAGRIKTQPPLGAMWKAEGIWTDIQFGWSLDQLYLRLDPDEQSQPRQAGLTVELQIQTPEHLYRLSFSLEPSAPTPVCAFTETSQRVLARDRLLPIDVSSEDYRTGCAIQGATAHSRTGNPLDHSGVGTSFGNRTLSAPQTCDLPCSRSGVRSKSMASLIIRVKGETLDVKRSSTGTRTDILHLTFHVLPFTFHEFGGGNARSQT